MLLSNRLPQSGELCSRVWTLLSQQLRFRNRPNLKRPLPAHFNRARMLAVCQPVYPPKPKNCQLEAIERNAKPENPVVDNPHAIFLAAQMRRDLVAHPMTCIFHYNNYTQHELIDIRGALYDMEFKMKIQERINANVAKMSFTGSRWAPLLPLMFSKTAIGYCGEDNLPRLMRALKKMPQFVLMALVIHGRILHKDAVEELVKLKDVTSVRAQLCSTLAFQSQTLSQNLTANINALSHSLSTHANPEPGSDDSSSSSSSSSSDSDGEGSSSSSSDSDSEQPPAKRE